MGGSTESLVFGFYGAIYELGPKGFSLGTLTAFLETFGLSPEAVRLALSRMARKGWFETKRKGRNSFYFLTDSGWRVVRGAESRSVFRGELPEWDGRFRLVSYEVPEERKEDRALLADTLRRAGYGKAAAALWVSAYEAPPPVRELLDGEPFRSYVTEYAAELRGDAKAFARRIWDTDALAAMLGNAASFLEARIRSFRKAADKGKPPSDAECFRSYFEGTDAFVSAMASTPPIPGSLLPDGWPADRLGAAFREHRDLVRDGTSSFIDRVYEPFVD